MPKIHLVIASNKGSKAAVNLWKGQALSWCKTKGVVVLSTLTLPSFDDITTLDMQPNTWLICDGNDGKKGDNRKINGLSPRIAAIAAAAHCLAAILLTSTDTTLARIKADVGQYPKLATKAFCHMSHCLFAALGTMHARIYQPPRLSALDGSLLAAGGEPERSCSSPPVSPESPT